MIEKLVALATQLLGAMLRADPTTAFALVALSALGVAALSLWALTVVVRAVTARKR